VAPVQVTGVINTEVVCQEEDIEEVEENGIIVQKQRGEGLGEQTLSHEATKEAIKVR